jgi:hypothetical protein
LPPAVREDVVLTLRDSELQVDHLVPVNILEKLIDRISVDELNFAVNRLLLPMCRKCNNGRWRLKKTKDEYLREYVLAVYAGDREAALRDAASWCKMEVIALHASLVKPTDKKKDDG